MYVYIMDQNDGFAITDLDLKGLNIYVYIQPYIGLQIFYKVSS